MEAQQLILFVSYGRHKIENLLAKNLFTSDFVLRDTTEGLQRAFRDSYFHE